MKKDNKFEIINFKKNGGVIKIKYLCVCHDTYCRLFCEDTLIAVDSILQFINCYSDVIV